MKSLDLTDGRVVEFNIKSKYFTISNIGHEFSEFYCFSNTCLFQVFEKLSVC